MRKRWIYRNGEAIEVSNDYSQEPVSAYVMPDIQPYTSMVDGSMITSRSQHKAHLKQHNCVEVGNDSSLYRAPKPHSPPPGLKDDIIRAVNAVEDRSRRR